MTEQAGPEPTGWELMRSITQLRHTVEGYASGTVSTGTLDLVQRSWDEKFSGQGREIGDLRIQLRDAKAEAAAATKTAEDQRSKNRQFWIGIVASPFIGAIATFIIVGGLRP
jgi:hypothetical protein